MAFSPNQLSNVLRTVAGPAATAVTILGGLSLMSPENATSFVNALHGFNDSVVSAYGYLTTMLTILAPVALVILGKVGLAKSSVSGMLQSIMSTATKDNGPQATDAKLQIVSAAADPRLGTTAIINPALAPSPVTPSNVVASPVDAAKFR